MKAETFPHPGKSSHWWGDQPGWKGSFGATEESSIITNQSAEGKMDSNLHRWSVPPPWAPQPETLICRCLQGLSAEAWASEVRFRERIWVGCTEPA